MKIPVRKERARDADESDRWVRSWSRALKSVLDVEVYEFLEVAGYGCAIRPPTKHRFGD
jgi:hypothetical protein